MASVIIHTKEKVSTRNPANADEPSSERTFTPIHEIGNRHAKGPLMAKQGFLTLVKSQQVAVSNTSKEENSPEPKADTRDSDLVDSSGISSTTTTLNHHFTWLMISLELEPSPPSPHSKNVDSNPPLASRPEKQPIVYIQEVQNDPSSSSFLNSTSTNSTMNQAKRRVSKHRISSQIYSFKSQQDSEAFYTQCVDWSQKSNADGKWQLANKIPSSSSSSSDSKPSRGKVPKGSNNSITTNAKPVSSYKPLVCFPVQQALFTNQALVDPSLLGTIHGSGSASSNSEMLSYLPACPRCLLRLDPFMMKLDRILCFPSMDEFQSFTTSILPCEVCKLSRDMQSACTEDGVLPVLNCSKCNATENLWICVVCSELGCSRYVQQHAAEHFRMTGHNLVMEVQSGAIWDYVGDHFVHRVTLHDKELLDNEQWQSFGAANESLRSSVLNSERGSGRITPASSLTGLEAALKAVKTDDDPNHDEEEEYQQACLLSKIDAAVQEYELMLTSRLESQRMFLEDEIRQEECRLLKELTQLEKRAWEKQESLSKLDKKFEQGSSRLAKLRQEKKAVKDDAGRIKESNAQYKSESLDAMNLQSSLKDMYRVIVKERKEQDEQVAALEDEIRDLTLHMKMLVSVRSSNPA